MDSIVPAFVMLVLVLGVVFPIILKMLFRHQAEMAEIAASGGKSPEILAEIQELKKQVTDLRELMIDVALKSSEPSELQERVKQGD